MKKRFLLLLYFSLAFTILNGQENNFNQAPLTLPSPQAAEFIRYGDIPVDYSTGVPNISIPIYTVVSGILSLPISISYNASGIKVTDVASTTGLGWSLSAGGLISRSVLGADDQQNKYAPYKKSADIDTALDHIRDLTGTAFDNGVMNFVDTAEAIFHQLYETQSDRYFYSFPGHSGVFRMDFETGQAKPVPYSPIKISLGDNNAGPYKIVDENGITYYFEKEEWSGQTTGGYYKTTYYLTKIQTPDSADEINIHYKADQQVSERIKSFQLVRVSGNPSTSQISNGSFVNSSVPWIVDSITSRNVTVQFQYLTDRPDPRKSRLVGITVLNRFSREIVRVVEFKQSYFGTSQDNNQRLRLDSIQIKSNTGITFEKYRFGYNSTALPAYFTNLAWNTDPYNMDYWGYYNGANSSYLIPKDLFTSQFTADDKNLYGGNRNPSSTFMQACILNRIDYPTGGKTLFEYEPNKVLNGYSYSTGINEDIYGGLRVKKISVYSDSLATPVIKSYKYQGGFHTIIQPEMYVYTSESMTWYMDGSSKYNIPTTNFNICAEAFTTLTTGGSTPVIYSNVQEFFGTESVNTGYVEYDYDNSSIPYYIYDPGTLGNPRFNGQYLTDNGNYQPQLSQRTLYKNENGQYFPVRRENYAYDYLRAGSFITGVKVERQTPFNKIGNLASMKDYDVACYLEPYSGCTLWLNWFINDYLYSNTTGVEDVSVLSRKDEIVYEPDGITNSTSAIYYTYDTVSLQPIQELFVNSEGDTINTFFKYPGDLSGTAPYNAMVSRNMLTPLIETEKFKGSNFLQKIRTNYKLWDNEIIAPEFIESKTLDSPLETRLHYYGYDSKGNVTSFAKHNDLRSSYIWDYNQTLPVAECINCEVNEMAFTSFEAQNKGNWSFDTAAVVYDFSAPTGTKCLDISSQVVSISGLTSSKKYIVSFWVKAGSNVNVSWGTQSNIIVGSVITGWTYTQREITGTQQIDIDGAGYVDELRLYPLNAQMTTYTYSPLIGITSMCSADNRVTYYEYDASNRLALVRDQDGKIIKRICYNYAGQPEDCIYYYNTELSQQFSKNDCPPGYVSGSPMTYTVLANTYGSAVSQGDANAKAQADIDANGQAYVNANTLCIIACFRCTGVNKKCVNDFCETGFKVYTDSYYDAVNNQTVCVYHYEWSDGSWSVDYYETNPGGGVFCIIQ